MPGVPTAQRDIAELWATVAAGGETTLEQRARCRLAAIYAGDSTRQAMDLMYRRGGSTSSQRASRLAACWRDQHLVGQTVTIAPSGIRSAAGCIWGWTRAQVCASQLPRHGLFADAKLIIDGEKAHVRPGPVHRRPPCCTRGAIPAGLEGGRRPRRLRPRLSPPPDRRTG